MGAVDRTDVRLGSFDGAGTRGASRRGRSAAGAGPAQLARAVDDLGLGAGQHHRPGSVWMVVRPRTASRVAVLRHRSRDPKVGSRLLRRRVAYAVHRARLAAASL